MNWIMYFISFILGGIVMFMTICISYAAKQEEPVNRVHFYVARDKNEELTLWLGKPFRGIDNWTIVGYSICIAIDDELNIYGVNSSNYDNLKWEDEPVEVFINMED